MLSDLIPHSLEEVTNLIEEYKTSTFEDYGSFKLLILRRPQLHGDRLEFEVESFIIKEDGCYQIHPKDFSSTQLDNAFEGLLRKLESYYASNNKIISSYLVGVEKLEDLLFDRNTPQYFMDFWFDLKRVLSKLDNYYYRNAIVYREFYKKMEAQFGDWKDDYKDIDESISFQVANINALMGRLDGVYNYFESIKADRLNKTLLSLTVISGVFLPLNLIVGFFGMNTPGLFFAQDSNGTQKVIIVLLAISAIFLVGFKVVRLIDQYLLRFFLGRYSFYQNITSKIEDISSRMHGH